jgi:hypothetical protein
MIYCPVLRLVFTHEYSDLGALNSDNSIQLCTERLLRTEARESRVRGKAQERVQGHARNRPRPGLLPWVPHCAAIPRLRTAYRDRASGAELRYSAAGVHVGAPRSRRAPPRTKLLAQSGTSENFWSILTSLLSLFHWILVKGSFCQRTKRPKREI